MKKLFLTACLFLLSSVYIHADISAKKTKVLVPTTLRCELRENPAGVDVVNPVLSWRLMEQDQSKRSNIQTAYQIIISSSADQAKKGIGDIYTSQKVFSDSMKHKLEEAGTFMQSSTMYWWNVKVWDKDGIESFWSQPAYWITGLLPGTDWQAEWISAEGAEKYALSYSSARTDFYRDREEYATPHPDLPKTGDLNYSSMVVEKDVTVQNKLRSAYIHISGLGFYELSINNKKVGDYKLTPGWSEYKKTVLYETYDVTSMLQSGNNTLSVLLGNGMYNIQLDMERYVKFLNTYGPLKVIAQLQLEYTDGRKEIIGTDQSWRVAPGPITYSNIFGGEDYDATLLPTAEWYKPLICKGPGGVLRGVSYSAPPIKAIEVLKAKSITEIAPNTYIYDLGQNASLIPRISVKGKAGTSIRIIPSELLKKDGTLDRSSSIQNGDRLSWWKYTLAGNGKESWFPLSFYQGGRFLQVELHPNEKGEMPVLESLEGVVVHSSSEPIGTFETSNELFNQIFYLVRWAQRSNMMSVMTDCPAREKLPWLEQNQLNGPALRYNYNMAPLYHKTMRDLADGQLGYGLIPSIVPEYFMAADPNIHPPTEMRNSPEWGSAIIFIPWHQYLFSGDDSLMKMYYDSMKRYVSYLDATAIDNIVYTGLGDWYDIGPKSSWGSQLTPPELTATATYYYDNIIMSKIAGLVGEKRDEIIYRLKAEEIRQAFNEKFFNKASGTYSTNSQTANAMPLALGLVDEENKESVINAIVNDIHSKDNSQTSGEIGYRFLLQVLADYGYSDLIYKINNRSDRPGYGYQIKKGATSLTERWDPEDTHMGSQNHFMFGQINEWFYHGLAGIQPDEENPGFRKFVIKPSVVGDLTWVKCNYQSVSGLISSEWNVSSNVFSLYIQVPVNTQAIVYIPFATKSTLKESGKKVSEMESIEFIKEENGYAVCRVGSGIYSFTTSLLQ